MQTSIMIFYLLTLLSNIPRKMQCSPDTTCIICNAQFSPHFGYKEILRGGLVSKSQLGDHPNPSVDMMRGPA